MYLTFAAGIMTMTRFSRQAAFFTNSFKQVISKLMFLGISRLFTACPGKMDSPFQMALQPQATSHLSEACGYTAGTCQWLQVITASSSAKKRQDSCNSYTKCNTPTLNFFVWFKLHVSTKVLVSSSICFKSYLGSFSCA